ncbi:hypothetical protein CMEL01_16377 [Colletotrichum melonis]|uniref:Uncharacterized protein n=1 Tax=Colletotrichum melonis TaxID=1209925 RepID=A0AAI9XMX3_9PEZI|nr:hypothetical protein CMEL01_16377 [Colletotrichum melonis]
MQNGLTAKIIDYYVDTGGFSRKIDYYMLIKPEAPYASAIQELRTTAPITKDYVPGGIPHEQIDFCIYLDPTADAQARYWLCDKYYPARVCLIRSTAPCVRPDLPRSKY